MDEILVVREEENTSNISGKIYLNGDFIGHTLEPTWKRNKKDSCIPVGEYMAYLRDAEQSGSRWSYNPIQLINVPERSYIQIHIGNYPKDTQGCILIGKGKGDNAVWSSGDCFKELVEKMDKTRPCKVIIKYKE